MYPLTHPNTSFDLPLLAPTIRFPPSSSTVALAMLNGEFNKKGVSLTNLKKKPRAATTRQAGKGLKAKSQPKSAFPRLSSTGAEGADSGLERYLVEDDDDGVEDSDYLQGETMAIAANKLRELEKLSLGNSLQHQLQKAQRTMSAFIPSSMSLVGQESRGLSDIESKFMLRQAEHGDVSSLVTHMDILPSVQPSSSSSIGIGSGVTGETGTGGLSDKTSMALFGKVGDVMRERITALEKQVVSLTTLNERKDRELETAEEKLRKSRSHAEQQKRTMETEKMRLQEMHEQALLSLKEKHLVDMAAVASAVAPPNHSGNGGERDHDHGPSSKGAPLGEAHKSLLNQLEVLRVESRRMQEQVDRSPLNTP